MSNETMQHVVMIHDKDHGNWPEALDKNGIESPCSIVSYTDTSYSPYNEDFMREVDKADVLIQEPLLSNYGSLAQFVLSTIQRRSETDKRIILFNDSYAEQISAEWTDK